MKSACFVLVAALCVPAFAQDSKGFLGRWDLTVSNGRQSWPQWMEVVQKGDGLDGRIQPRGGAVRPIVAAKVDGGHLLITVSAAGRGPEVDWDLTVAGNKISGVQKQGENSDTKIEGERAPEMKRPM